MRSGGKGDAIPLIEFFNAPLFKAGFFTILLSFELAVITPLSIAIIPVETRTRYISIVAKKYSYTPARIIVNKGDTVVISFSSRDVTHGFLLEGYSIELIAREGVTFRKDSRHYAKDNLRSDWNRVSTVKFVAHKTGKFNFKKGMRYKIWWWALNAKWFG